MYTPPYFKLSNRGDMLDLIRRNSFGMLLSPVGDRPEVTHIPFIVSSPGNMGSSAEEVQGSKAGQTVKSASTGGEGAELLFHVAAANPNPRPGKAMAIFQGPHAYISPSWYQEENTVPTWNYVAVHVRGELELIQDEEEIRNLMDTTIRQYEQSPSSWSIDWRDQTIKKMLSGIRCFRMKIEELEGKAKLSQNHSKERRTKVIHKLSQGSEREREVARLMAQKMEQP